jgi:hypothetical protein
VVGVEGMAAGELNGRQICTFVRTGIATDVGRGEEWRFWISCVGAMMEMPKSFCSSGFWRRLVWN